MTNQYVLAPPMKGLVSNLDEYETLIKPVDFTDSQKISILGTVTNSNMRFNTSLPGGDVLVDRTMYITYNVAVQIQTSSANHTAATFANSDVCLAQFPLHRVCNSLTVSINNVSKTVQPNLFINAISKYFSNYENRYDFSLCPNSPDLFNNHLLSGRPAVSTVDSSFPRGSQFSKNAAYDPESSRLVKVTNSALNTTASLWDLTFQVTEPLFSPLLEPDMHRFDMYGNVTQLRVELGFQSNLNGMLSVGYVADTSPARVDIATTPTRLPTVNFAGTPYLTFRTFRSSMSVPQQIKSHFNDVIVNTAAISGGATFSTTQDVQFTSGNLSYSTVPSKIFVFVRNQAEPNWLQADGYGAIQQLKVQTPSHSGLLSNLTPQDLYVMCRRAGLDQTFLQFNSTQGSVICLDVGTDFPAYVPGSQPNEHFYMNISGTFRNTCAGSFTDGYHTTTAPANRLISAWELTVVALIPSQLMISPNQAIEVGGLSDVSADMADESNMIPVEMDTKDLKSGGGFWKTFKNNFKKKNFDRGYFGTLRYLQPLAQLAGTAQTGNGPALRIGGGYRVQS